MKLIELSYIKPPKILLSALLFFGFSAFIFFAAVKDTPAKFSSSEQVVFSDPTSTETPTIPPTSTVVPTFAMNPEATFLLASQSQIDPVQPTPSVRELGDTFLGGELAYDMYIGKDTNRQADPIKNPPCKIVPAWKIKDIQSGYIAKTLKDLYTDGAYIEGEYYAVSALADLSQAASDAGYNQVNIRSGYRSFDFQTLIAKANGLPVGIDLAAPGRSEHQLGTVFDLGWANSPLNYAEINRTPLPAKFYKWLDENAHRYGFVISYPFKSIEGKTNVQMPFVTEYIAEPWHIRFVTVPFATAIWNYEDAGGKNYLDPKSQLTASDFYRPAQNGECKEQP